MSDKQTLLFQNVGLLPIQDANIVIVFDYCKRFAKNLKLKRAKILKSSSFILICVKDLKQ